MKLEQEVSSLNHGVHSAKAEKCTTPYMRRTIKINIGVGGLHGNQFAKNKRMCKQFTSLIPAAIPDKYQHFLEQRACREDDGWHTAVIATPTRYFKATCPRQFFSLCGELYTHLL